MKNIILKDPKTEKIINGHLVRIEKSIFKGVTYWNIFLNNKPFGVESKKRDAQRIINDHLTK